MHQRNWPRRDTWHALAPAGENLVSRHLHLARESVAIEAERPLGCVAQLRQTLPELVDRALVAAARCMVKPHADLNEPLKKQPRGTIFQVEPLSFQHFMRFEKEPGIEAQSRECHGTLEWLHLVQPASLSVELVQHVQIDSNPIARLAQAGAEVRMQPNPKVRGPRSCGNRDVSSGPAVTSGQFEEPPQALKEIPQGPGNHGSIRITPFPRRHEVANRLVRRVHCRASLTIETQP